MKHDASSRSSATNTGSAANRFTSSSDQRIPDYGSAQLHYSQNWQILQLIALFSTKLKYSSYSVTSSTRFASKPATKD